MSRLFRGKLSEMFCEVVVKTGNQFNIANSILNWCLSCFFLMYYLITFNCQVERERFLFDNFLEDCVISFRRFSTTFGSYYHRYMCTHSKLFLLSSCQQDFKIQSFLDTLNQNQLLKFKFKYWNNPNFENILPCNVYFRFLVYINRKKLQLFFVRKD